MRARAKVFAAIIGVVAVSFLVLALVAADKLRLITHKETVLPHGIVSLEKRYGWLPGEQTIVVPQLCPPCAASQHTLCMGPRALASPPVSDRPIRWRRVTAPGHNFRPGEFPCSCASCERPRS